MIGFDLQPGRHSTTPVSQDRVQTAQAEARLALGRIRQQIREQEQARELANHNIQVLRQAESELLAIADETAMIEDHTAHTG